MEGWYWVICAPWQEVPHLGETFKFLVPYDYTVSSLWTLLTQWLKFNSNQGLILYINKSERAMAIPHQDQTIANLF